MPSLQPAAGTTVVSSGQVLFQQRVVVSDDAFGSAAISTSVQTNGLPRLRIQCLLYPKYVRNSTAANAQSFVARNFLSYRVLGAAAPFAPISFDDLVPPGNGGSDVSAFIPITPPRLLPVGVPQSFEINAGGFYAIAVEFDTSSGTDAADQGFDLVYYTISASS